jgi:uncharacterized protein YjdB
MTKWSLSGTYNGSMHEDGAYGGNTDAKITIKFYGTEFRIISVMCRSGISNQVSKNVSVTLDGTLLDSMNVINSTDAYVWQSLNYEKTDLHLRIHTIVLNPEDKLEYPFDAVDIDSTGYMVSPNTNSITLNKTTDSLQVGQTDTLTATITPDNATNKAVTWTSSDPTANCTVNITEATNPTQPTDNTGNAILTITMTNGNVKSYTVSMTKVNDFISWYDNRVSGSSGKAYYTFDKTDNLQPFSKKNEYLVFDKISSYEVDEYSK